MSDQKYRDESYLGDTEDDPQGPQVQDLGFPRDSTVVAIIRQEHVVVPRGDTVLRPDDEVLVLVTAESESEVRKLLTSPAQSGTSHPES